MNAQELLRGAAMAVLGGTLLMILPGTMACTADRAAGPGGESVRELANETLQANGLGPLVVHETTLGEVLARYGCGSVQALAGDEFVAIELVFARGGLRLFFLPDPRGPTHRTLLWMGLRTLTAAVRTPPEDLRQAHPELHDLPLHSIAVQAPFFTGATNHGARLGDKLEEVERRHGSMGISGGPEMHAGLTSSDARPRPFLSAGLKFYPDRKPLQIPGTIVEPSNMGFLQPRVEMIVAYGSRLSGGDRAPNLTN